VLCSSIKAQCLCAFINVFKPIFSIHWDIPLTMSCQCVLSCKAFPARTLKRFISNVYLLISSEIMLSNESGATSRIDMAYRTNVSECGFGYYTFCPIVCGGIQAGVFRVGVWSVNARVHEIFWDFTLALAAGFGSVVV
jgi:hypothetical protein